MRYQGLNALLAVSLIMGLTACGGGEQEPGTDAPEGLELSTEDAQAQQIEELLQVGDDDVGRLYQAGLSLARLGELEPAAAKLETARDLAPENSVIHRSLWYVYRRLGRKDDALVELEATVKLDPDNLDVGLELVQDYARRRRLADARATLEHLEQVHPSVAAVHASAGALARGEGDGEGARAAFDRALAIDAREPEALFGLGILEQQAGNLVVAGERFAAAVEAAPDHLGARMGLGSLELLAGDYETAAAHFLQVLQLDPRYFPARRSLGNALLLDGLYDEAVTLFEQGIRLSPQELDPHFYLGKAYLQRGRLEEAEEQFEFVARSDNRRLDAFVELARMFSLSGELDRCVAAIRQAVALGFRDFGLLHDDPDFENLMAAANFRSQLDEIEGAAAGNGQ